ncbi:MAG: choice-of-anchor J domain-containing protein, partial [Bacteroidia bacterium]|nr:choice-of-anchor J domain-containing protein [Bacteroidia bacterium]
GQSLTFTSYSWGKPHQFQWEIRQGASVVVSSTDGPCATISAPAAPGTYDVYLSVSNQVGSDDTLYSGFLVVRDPAQAASFPFTEGFESSTFPPTGWVRVNPDAATGNSNLTWERYSSAGRGSFGASNANVRIRNWSYFNRTQRDYLITPLISIPASAQNPAVEFDVYYRALYWENSTASPPAYGYLYGDTLAVSISDDCGATWSRLYYKGGEDLDVTGTAIQVVGTNPSASQHQSVPPSGSNTDWVHEVVPIPASYKGKSVLIRFENITEMGNNLYIDSIQVRENVSTSYVHSSRVPVVSLFPNPATEEVQLWVQHASAGRLFYRLVSLTGQILQQSTFSLQGGEVRQSLAVDKLPTGVYLVEVELSSGERYMLRLVKE